MASFAKVIVIGNLTRDIECRYTPKGTAVAELDVAVNRKWKTEAGEDREEVSFLTWTAWGRRAEIAAEYLAKGSPVFLEGYPHQENWDDKETGQKRSKLKFVVENMQFIGGRKASGGGDATEQRGPTDKQLAQQAPEKKKAAPAAAPAKAEAASVGESEDRIPF